MTGCCFEVLEEPLALVVVLGGAATAAIMPARRASRVDPNAVLHYE